MNYILIPNNWIRTFTEFNYTYEAIFIYGLLQKNKTIRNQIIFNITWIFESLNISKNNTKGQERIRKILNQFQQDNIIDFGVDVLTINKNKLIFASMYDIEDTFTQILDHEFDSIHGYCGKIDSYIMFCVFCNIKSRIDDKGYCYPSMMRIMQDLDIANYGTLINYLKILQNELGLLLYDNPGAVVGEDGTVRQSNNTYVMNYEGNYNILKDAIDKRRDELRKLHIVLAASEDANNRRSISMKKHWELKKTGGSKTEVEHIKLVHEVEEDLYREDF